MLCQTEESRAFTFPSATTSSSSSFHGSTRAPPPFVPRALAIYRPPSYLSSRVRWGRIQEHLHMYTLCPRADNRVVDAIPVYTTNVHLSDTSPFRNPVRKAPGRLFSGSRLVYPDKVLEVLVLSLPSRVDISPPANERTNERTNKRTDGQTDGEPAANESVPLIPGLERKDRRSLAKLASHGARYALICRQWFSKGYGELARSLGHSLTH